MSPFFPDMGSEGETTADLPSDSESTIDEREQERAMRIAGVLARHAEEAGLIHATDEFSWEWHQQFDSDIEAAQAAASAAFSPADADHKAPPAEVTVSAPFTAGEFGTDFGTGGTFGGDLGGGGGLGGNF